MKINCFYIFVIGLNVIVCLPQSNQHESSLNDTAGNDNKSIEDEGSLKDDNIKDKDENTSHVNNIKHEVVENKTKTVNTNEKIGKADVLNTNEGTYTNQRPVPYDYGQQAIPHRWLPAPPRYVVPVLPRTSEQVFTSTYDTSSEKDVHESEVLAEPHINEPIIKTPMETVYVVPPQIAYSSEPADAIIQTPYLAPYPNDYNSQESGVAMKPWIYPHPYVRPRYFRTNGHQPYYRHAVYPSPRYTPINLFPPPFDYGTTQYYKEPWLPMTFEERFTDDLHEKRPGKTVEGNNNRRKPLITVSENLTDFVRTIPDYNEKDDRYPIYYYPGKPHNTDYNNDNSQSNNYFESSEIDISKISGYLSPDTAYEHPQNFPRNVLERHTQDIYSPYHNAGPKEKLESFDNVYKAKENDKPDSSVDNISKNVIESQPTTKPVVLEPVFNDKTETNESTTDTHIISKDKTENLSTILLNIHGERKKPESLKVTNKEKDEMMSPDRTLASFDNMESNKSALEQSILSNEYIYKDSTDTRPTKITAELNNNNNGTVNVKDVIIEITELQPSCVIGDQDTGSQIQVLSDDNDKFTLNNDDRSTASTEKVNVNNIREENFLINRNEINSRKSIETQTIDKINIQVANNVQPKEFMEKSHDDRIQERVDDSVDVKIQKDTQYNKENNNFNQVGNKTVFPENLNQKKSSENNNKEEHEKSNPKNDKQDFIKFENTFYGTTSDNSYNQESDENSDENKRHDKENFDKIRDVVLNPETIKSHNESDKNDIGDKDIEYPGSVRITDNSSSQEKIENSDRKQPQTKLVTHNIDNENKNQIFEIISNKNKEEIIISKQEPERKRELDECEDDDNNNNHLKNISIEYKENDKHEKRTDSKMCIDQGINKNPVEHTHGKEVTWYNDKEHVAIDVNPKINDNGKKNQLKDQSGNDNNSEHKSDANDIKLVEAVTTTIDNNTSLQQETLAPSISAIDSNVHNNFDLNDADKCTDEFDEISEAQQITSEESIKSRLAFKTTCIRHPVDISISDDSKNATEPKRLQFYNKILEEYYKNHNVIPRTVLHKDILSFIYKNGTVVNVITATVWNVENDGQLRLKKIIKQRQRINNCK